jgi:hypothetical protein
MALLFKRSNQARPGAEVQPGLAPATATPVVAPQRRHPIMRRLFILLIFLAVVALVFGYFRDWYAVSTQSEPDNDDFNVKMNVHVAKFKADSRAAVQYVQNLAGHVNEKSSDKQSDE